MRVLSFYAAHGIGSAEFRRQAGAAARAWDTEAFPVDNRLPRAKRAEAVLQELTRDHFGGQSPDGVAFFCHGWRTGIQLGFGVHNADALADAMPGGADSDIVVALYSCSAGADPRSWVASPGTGDNSFADSLRDAMCAGGLDENRVVAHTTVGHTTSNPYARFFDGSGSDVGGVGGYYPVMPRSSLWPEWWRRLRAPGDTLRFDYPFMSVSALHAELGGQG